MNTEPTTEEQESAVTPELLPIYTAALFAESAYSSTPITPLSLLDKI